MRGEPPWAEPLSLFPPIERHLIDSGFALRYRTDEADDRLSGEADTFLVCSFWPISALAIAGETHRASDGIERLAELLICTVVARAARTGLLR